MCFICSAIDLCSNHTEHDGGTATYTGLEKFSWRSLHLQFILRDRVNVTGVATVYLQATSQVTIETADRHENRHDRGDMRKLGSTVSRHTRNVLAMCWPKHSAQKYIVVAQCPVFDLFFITTNSDLPSVHTSPFGTDIVVTCARVMIVPSARANYPLLPRVNNLCC